MPNETLEGKLNAFEPETPDQTYEKVNLLSLIGQKITSETRNEVETRAKFLLESVVDLEESDK